MARKGPAALTIAWAAGLLMAVDVAIVALAALRPGSRWHGWDPFALPQAPALSKGLTVALTILVFAAALPPSIKYYGNPDHYLTFQQAASPQGLMGFLKAQGGSEVVLADPGISPKIPGLTGHYIVATDYSHDPIPDWDRRQAAVRAVLSGEGPWEAARAALSLYGVRFVVAEKARTEGAALRLLDGHPEALERCFEAEGFIVWRVS